MRIVHIIDSLITGGAEMLLCNFINQYKREHPDSTHYIVTLKKDLTLLPFIEHNVEGIQRVVFSKHRSPLAVFILRKHLKKMRPDLVHTHLFYPTLLGRLSASRDIPVVSTYHNMEYCKESPNYSSKYILLDKLTFKRGRHFSIYVSNAVKSCVQRAVPIQLSYGEVIPNFVTGQYTRQYRFKDGRQIKMVAVGNLKKVKNHLYALQELATLQDLEISLDIFGTGSLFEELSAYIKTHDLPVRLMGTAHITSSLLSEYDVFLLPSLSEGMPVSLIEAIVSGLPCLVSDLPQLIETAGDAALYFSPARPGSLAALLRMIYNDKQQLVKLSEAAKDIAFRYDWKSHFESVEKIYRRAVNSASAKS